MEFNSIAMIETNGLVSAIAALEVMLKFGDTKFLKKEVISNGQVIVFVEGNVPNLRMLLQAGEIAAKNVGIVISSFLIENPDNSILDIILERNSREISKQRKIEKKIKKVEPEKIVTFFDNVDEFKSHDAPEIVVEEAEVLDAPEISVEEIEFLDAPEIVVEESEIPDSPEIVVEEAEILDSPEIVVEEAEILDTPEIVVEESETSDAPEIVVEESEILDAPELVVEESETSDAPEIVVEESEILDTPEIVVEESDASEIVVEESEVLASPKNVIKESETSGAPKVVIEETKETQSKLINLSHLERLRAEAKLEIERESLMHLAENIEAKTEAISSDYLKMNVHELRKLARSNPNFPIKGREISKANRGLLINYLNQIL